MSCKGVGKDGGAWMGEVGFVLASGVLDVELQMGLGEGGFKDSRNGEGMRFSGTVNGLSWLWWRVRLSPWESSQM